MSVQPCFPELVQHDCCPADLGPHAEFEARGVKLVCLFNQVLDDEVTAFLPRFWGGEVRDLRRAVLRPSLHGWTDSSLAADILGREQSVLRGPVRERHAAKGQLVASLPNPAPPGLPLGQGSHHGARAGQPVDRGADGHGVGFRPTPSGWSNARSARSPGLVFRGTMIVDKDGRPTFIFPEKQLGDRAATETVSTTVCNAALACTW